MSAQLPLIHILRSSANGNSTSVHPGAVNTEMQNQWEDAYPGFKGFIAKHLALFTGRSIVQGCYSGLWAALSPEVPKNDWNGAYFSDPATLGKESAQGQDVNLATALWELSERMIKRIVGGDDPLASWS